MHSKSGAWLISKKKKKKKTELGFYLTHENEIYMYLTVIVTKIIFHRLSRRQVVVGAVQPIRRPSFLSRDTHISQE